MAKIVPYKGRYPRATSKLHALGLLRQYPSQKYVILFRDHGVNITYRLKGCTPEKFKAASHLFLEVAEAECKRYLGMYKWMFARLEVELNRTAKGRKSLPLRITYSAGKHTDPDIMVWGLPGLEVEKTNFLIDKVEEILDIPMRYIGRVNRQRPYTVTEMQVCMRAGVAAILPGPSEEEKAAEAWRERKGIPV